MFHMDAYGKGWNGNPSYIWKKRVSLIFPVPAATMELTPCNLQEFFGSQHFIGKQIKKQSLTEPVNENLIIRGGEQHVQWLYFVGVTACVLKHWLKWTAREISETSRRTYQFDVNIRLILTGTHIHAHHFINVISGGILHVWADITNRTLASHQSMPTIILVNRDSSQ